MKTLHAAAIVCRHVQSTSSFLCLLFICIGCNVRVTTCVTSCVCVSVVHIASTCRLSIHHHLVQQQVVCKHVTDWIRFRSLDQRHGLGQRQPQQAGRSASTVDRATSVEYRETRNVRGKSAPTNYISVIRVRLQSC